MDVQDLGYKTMRKSEVTNMSLVDYLLKVSTFILASRITLRTSEPSSSKKAHCCFTNSDKDERSVILSATREIRIATELGIIIKGSVNMKFASLEGASLVRHSTRASRTAFVIFPPDCTFRTVYTTFGCYKADPETASAHLQQQ